MNLRVGILTVSDRSARGERPDLAGPALIELISSKGWQTIEKTILPDEIALVSDLLTRWCDSKEIDVILTTGGTGFSPRDVTPEATAAVIERAAPGLSEAMRIESMKVTPHAMLSRAMAGIRKRTLIVNLPGNPKGAVENLSVILPVLPHAVQLMRDEPQAEAGHKATEIT